MKTEKGNPVAVAAANRVGNVVELDTPDAFTNNQKSDENPAVIIIAQRLGVTITHSRIVCHLAGIGGGHE